MAGQVIGYLMMDLRKSMGIKHLVAGVETAIIAVLGEMDVVNMLKRRLMVFM